MMEFYSSHIYRARKKHTCDFCLKCIKPGELYSNESGKFDGEFFVRKLCMPCKNMLDEYLQSSGDSVFDWASVHDYLRANWCTENCSEYEREECSLMPQRCYAVRLAFQPNNGEENTIDID